VVVGTRGRGPGSRDDKLGGENINAKELTGTKKERGLRETPLSTGTQIRVGSEVNLILGISRGTGKRKASYSG